MELEMCTTEPRSMQSISILNQFFFFKNSNLIQKHIKGFVNRQGIKIILDQHENFRCCFLQWT